MKARHIRRLRKKLNKVQLYKIRETAGLFGDFDGFNRLGLTMSDSFVSASTPIRAINIYMKRYRRDRKKINEYERDHYIETTESWGRLMVVDESGFKRFYK